MNAALPPPLQQPEGKTLEFKRDLSSPRNVLETLVAFATRLQTLKLLRPEQGRLVPTRGAVLHLGHACMNYKRHIVPLLERGLLTRTIPDKPHSPLQRYRLTSQGRALLENPLP